MAKRSGATLGTKARQQVGEMYSDWYREYQNDPVGRTRPPIHSNWLRVGVLQTNLDGQTITPAIAHEWYFNRNDAESGARGSWAPKLDNNGQPVTFLVVDFFMVFTKKLAASRKLGCLQIARDLWQPVVSECWQ